MKLGILTSFHGHIENYTKACEELNIDYEVIDFVSANWLDNIRNAKVDGVLCHPPCDFQERKSMLDERLYFVDKYLKLPIYPNFDSLYIYENKRNMAYWLEVNNIPHSKTKVITTKQEAEDFFKDTTYPVVLKSNIGAGGNMVHFIESQRSSSKYIRQIFGYKGGLFCKGLSPRFKKYGIPFKLTGGAQKHYMVLQEFHKIKWEWRIIKIGNTYSGHKKLLKGHKASGSGLVGWDHPPAELLYFVKDICDKGKFDSMAVDIFETVDGQYLVNELQAMFGAHIPYQMKKDGKPGMFLYTDKDGFVFEEGEFYRLKGNLLRISHFVEKLIGNKNN